MIKANLVLNLGLVESSINLLVKRDRENFYFSLCGFLGTGRNPENTFKKPTLLRFLIVPNEILMLTISEGRDDMRVKMTQQRGNITLGETNLI